MDQGFAFENTFISLAKASNIEVVRTGIAFHSSLGTFERYQDSLQKICRKFKVASPNMDHGVLLAFSIYAMNNTLGHEGLVPSVLVFGEFSSLHMIREDLQSKANLDERAKLRRIARREREQHKAKLRVQRTLRHNGPPLGNITYQTGDKVLFWRKKFIENRIGKWIGPYELNSVDNAAQLI